jgi:hypothetical protein
MAGHNALCELVGLNIGSTTRVENVMRNGRSEVSSLDLGKGGLVPRV